MLSEAKHPATSDPSAKAGMVRVYYAFDIEVNWFST
jgi:hypothetical protein